MQDICKSFDGKAALDDAQLELQEGEILGLVGDNGAGKSTLLKILSGVIRRDDGDIFIRSQKVVIRSPVESRRLGIEMVYQDLSLCTTLSIWENVYLGRYLVHRVGNTRFPLLEKREMTKRASMFLKELGVELSNLHQPVRTLSGGQQQAVALCRCLLFQPRIILLDEPTASMALWEKERVLGIIRGFKARGQSIVMVTHNLQDLYQVADRVLVLKEGKSIWCGSIEAMRPDELARLMFVGKA